MVTWVDSKGITNCWEDLEDIEPLEPCECVSIGWLIDDGDVKDYITIASSISGDQVLGRLSIPKQSILKMQKLVAEVRIEKIPVGETNGIGVPNLASTSDDKTNDD